MLQFLCTFPITAMNLTFIGVIVMLFLYFKLRERVNKLEERLGARAVPNAPATEVQATQEQAPSAMPEQVYESKPEAADLLIAWVKEDWLLKLGELLLLIGFGWLTTYAFLNNWIGPMGRILIGIVAGVLLLSFGWIRMRKYVHQGSIFLVTGSTTILLTTFAAREFYGYFTPSSALGIMFLSTAFVALVSVKYNNKPLAIASLILASVAPLLTNSPSPDFVALFLYLLAVVAGTLWIVSITKMRELTTVALVIISLYSIPLMSGQAGSDQSTLLYIAYIFAALFFASNTTGILKLKGKDMLPDLITAAGNGLLLLFWIVSSAPDHWKSMIISLWMVVFIFGAFFIFKATKKKEPFYVYAGVGIAMLATATAVELQGAALTIAYTVEAVSVVMIAYLLLKNLRISQKLILLLIPSVFLSIESLSAYGWRNEIPYVDFFVLLILGCAFLGLALFFRSLTLETKDKDLIKVNSILFVVGSFYIFALIWLTLKALLLVDDTAVMISLIIYTVVGLATNLTGRIKNIKGLLVYGGALLGLVVLRLFLVDVWRMEMSGRIITFFLIGALLMSTAFIGRKHSSDSISNNSI